MKAQQARIYNSQMGLTFAVEKAEILNVRALFILYQDAGTLLISS